MKHDTCVYKNVDITIKLHANVTGQHLFRFIKPCCHQRHIFGGGCSGHKTVIQVSVIHSQESQIFMFGISAIVSTEFENHIC